MKLDEIENKDAGAWFLFAGLAALLLSFFLFRVDNYQSNAKGRDYTHAQMMREMRIAQSSLPSRVTDARQEMPLIVGGHVKPVSLQAGAAQK